MRNGSLTRCLHATLLAAALIVSPANPALAEPTITLVHRNTDIVRVMEMLSRTQRVNILLSPQVGGDVSFSLYDVPLSEAIRSIANAAGYAAEQRNGTYFVVPREEAGAYADSDLTVVELFPVQYADPGLVMEMLRPYLSDYGSVTSLASHKLIMIEDRPAFIRRIGRLLGENRPAAEANHDRGKDSRSNAEQRRLIRHRLVAIRLQR